MEISKLGRHCFADDDSAGLAQPSNRGRIGFRTPACENWRTAFGRIVAGIEYILDTDRNAVQRTDALAISLFLIERSGLHQRVLGIDMGEGLDLTIHLGNALQAGRRIILSRNHAARDFASDFGCRKCGYVRLGQCADSL